MARTASMRRARLESIGAAQLNIEMPRELKDRLDSFCERVTLKQKNVVIKALEDFLEKYDINE